MTIPQARRAGRLFAISQLGRRVVDAAERVQAQVLTSADHVLAASQWAADSLVHDCGVAADRVTVLYPGPGMDVPTEREGRNAGGREILFVGIDWERKGGPMLYDAFCRVHKILPDATLRIVGCRPELRHPSVFVEGLLDKRDPIQAQRLVECYQAAACFCLPSLFEPFGISLSEAATMGLPAVSLDLGARREAIVDGVTGALAKEPTAAALADALVDVLKDPARCEAMGEAARTYAEAHFSWDVTAPTIGRILEQRQPVEAKSAASDFLRPTRITDTVPKLVGHV